MKPRSADDVMELLDAPYLSASLGAALELGLFWRLAERPQHAEELAATLGIPLNRCRYWLQLLERAALVERTAVGYAPTPVTRTAILGTLAPESWAQLAVESRETFPGLRDLAVHLRTPGSAFAALGLRRPDYVALMSEDPDRARRFTRMLYEIHGDFAERLAGFLDLGPARHLLDIGGGSGVVSLALLRRHPRLSAVVIDLGNVCAAGRELAVEQGLAERITFQAVDFLRDEIPGGFDVAIECDVNVYDDAFFRRIRAALTPGGRFLVVDQFAPAPDAAPAARVHWALEGALDDPAFAFPTAAEVKAALERAGFAPVSILPLPPAASGGDRFGRDYAVVDARTPLDR